ncbi:MAG TPA: 6,7-dimethyl-8-ribityllumazine synthase [Candidatus Baltobacteraceae bacterium]|nr:6,7-dimethyl-8-ribityllumazine synthase [Candidatus Baltobacteraceae bacterium]
MKKERSFAAPDCSGKRFAIVVARFYEQLADWLEDGARRALADCGVRPEDVAVYHVPGCFELPLAAKRLIAADDRLDGVVALGVVVRGQTPHFDYVAGECARGIMTVQIATGMPIGFGVLTTENLEQAEDRAHPQRGDKGYEAALAAAALLHVPRPEPARETLGFRRASS